MDKSKTTDTTGNSGKKPDKSGPNPPVSYLDLMTEAKLKLKTEQVNPQNGDSEHPKKNDGRHSNLSAIYRRRHHSPESQGEVSHNKDNDIPLEEWEAESIIGEEFYDGKPQYWVRWKATLEHESNLKNMGNLLVKWKAMKPKIERRSGAAGITKRRGQPQKIPLD
ncbi:hypothetical protein V8F33_009034 [Rhypophila sp. PSN 637]